MGTALPVTGIISPLSGTDPFVRTDFTTNWALLDGAPGVFICSSSTHPTWGSSQNGRLILETDTNNVLQWNGTSFVTPKTQDADWRSKSTTLLGGDGTGNTAGTIFTMKNNITTAQTAATTAQAAAATAQTTANQTPAMSAITSVHPNLSIANDGAYHPLTLLTLNVVRSGRVTVWYSVQFSTDAATADNTYNGGLLCFVDVNSTGTPLQSLQMGASITGNALAATTHLNVSGIAQYNYVTNTSASIPFRMLFKAFGDPVSVEYVQGVAVQGQAL